jgi:hypothetical protein
MSGLENMIDVGAHIARGAQIGLEAQRLKLSQEAQAADQDYRERSFEESVRERDRDFTQRGEEFGLRKDEYTQRKNMQDRAVAQEQMTGDLAGQLSPQLFQQPKGKMGRDAAGTGGMTAPSPGPTGSRFFTPPMMAPSLLSADEPAPGGFQTDQGASQMGPPAIPMDAPEGQEQTSGSGQTNALGNVDWHNAPAHLSQHVIQSVMGQMQQQQAQQRERHGRITQRDDMLKKIKGLPGVLGQLANDPGNQELWEPAAARLGPRMGPILLESLQGGQMADSEMMEEQIRSTLHGMSQREPTGYQQFQMDQKRITPESIANIRSLHPEILNSDSKALAYLEERASGNVNQMSAPGAGERHVNLERDPEYLHLKSQADDAEHEWKAADKAWREHFFYQYGEDQTKSPEKQKERDQFAKLAKEAKDAKAARDAARREQYGFLKSISGKGQKAKADLTPAPRDLEDIAAEGWSHAQQSKQAQPQAAAKPAAVDDQIPDDTIDAIFREHPKWSDEQVMQEARKRHGAR